MDHLACPRSSIIPIPRLPYICIESYDEGDFMTYPTRFYHRNPALEWVSTILPTANRVPFWLLQRQNPSPDDEIASFFQAWIFFGLLHELLGPFHLFDAAHFVGVDAEGTYVHTRRLEVKLLAWTREVHRLDLEEQEATKTRLLQCLQLAYQSMKCLLPSEDEPGVGHPEFNRAIRTSLASICETISAVGDMALDGVLPDLDWPYFNIFSAFNETERAQMRSNGWCPSLIGAAERDFGSVAAGFFLQRMEQPGLGIDHGGCTSSGCQKLQIDERTYEPRHVDISCGCSYVGPDFEEVAACLERGSFPVLEVTEDAERKVALRVLEFKQGLPFVALSHVWVDGLGNPAAIALPQCQLVRLRDLVQRLVGKTFLWGANPVEKEERGPLYLWCDSLLCPVLERPASGLSDEGASAFYKSPSFERSKLLKNAAIAKLKTVYQEASYVLVLDRALEGIQFADVGYLEATIRLLTSRWMQRLWTFQEAQLPQKLLIQFKDEAVDFRILAQAVKDSYKQNPVLRSLAHNVIARCIDLRSMMFLMRTGGPDLWKTQLSVRYRRVSVAKDEPICLSLILGLDTAKIDKATTLEARMETLWKLLAQTERGVPDDIVFNKFPRLSKEGYRWAPLTFQEEPTAGPRFLTNPFVSKKATLTDSGICIRRPGWRLQVDPLPWGTSAEHEGQILGGVQDFLYIEGPNGQWFSANDANNPYVKSMPIWNLLSRFPNQELYLLLDTFEHIGQGREAILGTMEGSRSGEVAFCPLMYVNVRPLEPHWAKVMQASIVHAEELRRHYSFRWYQFLRACGAALRRLPLPTRRDVVPWLSWPVGWWSKRFFRRLITQLRRLGDVDYQTEDVADAMRIASSGIQSDGIMSLAGHIGVQLMRRSASVEEAFGEEHEWCVN